MEKKFYLVVGAAIFIICGQIIALDTHNFWPFSKINVYRKFPSDYFKNSRNVVAITDKGEIDVVLTGNANFRMVHRFTRSFYRAKTPMKQQIVAQQLCDYIKRTNPDDFVFLGVRFYKLRWNLQNGQIIESTLIYEFYKQ